MNAPVSAGAFSVASTRRFLRFTPLKFLQKCFLWGYAKAVAFWISLE
jgi:hypothetical protein